LIGAALRSLGGMVGECQRLGKDSLDGIEHCGLPGLKGAGRRHV
jgi:hypothetical protein